jgi:hypothetical protein
LVIFFVEDVTLLFDGMELCIGSTLNI